MYFGFEDGKKRTLQEVGESLGITREYVRQLIDEGLKRLRPILKKELKDE